MVEPDTIKEIRTELRAKDMALAGTIPPVRSIATIGGLFANGVFRGTDEASFEHVICYLADSGIPVAPDFTITNYNLDPEYGGRDFLDRPDPADLLVFLMVFNPETPRQVRRYSDHSKDSIFCVSPAHSDRAFRETARATTARFIACQAFGRTEIGEWVFSSEAPAETDHQYEIVTSTDDRFHPRLRETFNGWGIPPCSFSCEKNTLGLLAQAFAARPDPGEKATILHKTIRNLRIPDRSCP